MDNSNDGEFRNNFALFDFWTEEISYREVTNESLKQSNLLIFNIALNN